jgi:hypothetical protein
MDWSSAPELLQLICDDNLVEDNPNKGICGSPATHMSLADLGADGVLLLGTTTNSIIAIGFKSLMSRRAGVTDTISGVWACDGLAEDFRVGGFSKNTVSGLLRDQTWWNLKSVNEYKGKNGARPGNLPVAVYSYQNFSDTQPGYRSRDAGGRMGKCPWKWAVCGKRICMRGHMSLVQGVAPCPTERVFLSVSADCTARLYDMNDHVMIDSVHVLKPGRSVTWWCKKDNLHGMDSRVLGAQQEGSAFAVGHEDGSFSVWLVKNDLSLFVNPERCALRKLNYLSLPLQADRKIRRFCGRPRRRGGGGDFAVL